jgi:hypothetical protein
MVLQVQNYCIKRVGNGEKGLGAGPFPPQFRTQGTSGFASTECFHLGSSFW